MEQMSIEKDEIDYIGDDELENYKNILNNLISLKEINILKERLKIDEEKIEKMKQTEINVYESEIDEYSFGGSYTSQWRCFNSPKNV